MDLKLGFRRARGILRNARGTHQESLPDQSQRCFVCPACGNLDIHYFDPPEGDERLFADAPSRTVHAAGLRAASSSCLACRAMLSLLEQGPGGIDDEETVVIRAFENTLVFDTHQPPDLPSGRYELYRQRQSENPPKLWPAVGTARTLGPHFSISDAHALIVSWMDECTSKHTECGRNADSRLPTRVIAVGLGDKKDPYLYETQRNETGRYIVLSHCWGPPEHRPPRTTNANLSQRKLSIPVKDLPPTFSDAVQLSRALEISYLWIDSLCIIQDNAADWEQEAARMADVYKSAVLTISADGAVDSRVGLFPPVKQRRHSVSIKTCCPADFEAATDPEYLYGRMTDLYVNMDRVFGVHTAGSAEDAEPLSR
ncbi:hypothetical protein MMYC01_201473 [Madurella mycetomatis]|uniref:Heterokaryon incompatibility domain-containing protein n=1 Tax=Madurella mycetomatis TaxID=100816 RepID=A0A175WFY5_9PEZI|nr:hypothetical protein MMYC01_201473 [Madurella mycetomatis]